MRTSENRTGNPFKPARLGPWIGLNAVGALYTLYVLVQSWIPAAERAQGATVNVGDAVNAILLLGPVWVVLLCANLYFLISAAREALAKRSWLPLRPLVGVLLIWAATFAVDRYGEALY